MTWLEILRMALVLYRAIQEKTRKQCPCKTCPLGLNKPTDIHKEPSADELIKHQEELYRKNHPKKG